MAKKHENSFREKFYSTFCAENDSCVRIEIKDKSADYTRLLSFLSQENQKKFFVKIDLENFNKLGELTEAMASNGYDIFLLGNPVTGDENKIYKISDNLKNWLNILSDKKGIDNLFCVKKEQSLFISFISHSAGGKGGSEKSLLDMIDGLIKRGVLIHVIMPSPGPFEEEIKKRPVAYDIISFPWILKDDEKEISEINRQIEASALEIAENLKAVNPDIVFTNTSVTNVGAIAAKKLKIPHVWHIREFGSRDHNLKFIMDEEERLKYVYENSQKIFFNSQALKKFFESSIPPDKSEIVYNVAKVVSKGAEKENRKLFKNNNSLKLIMAGEIRPGKNQKDAVLAVRELIRNKKNVELVIIGSWQEEYYQELMKIINESNIQNSVTFSGRVTNAQALMDTADINLMCSINEAFGKVTVEAMLQKRPVIGTESGGTVEIIKDGFNGFLYEPGNHKQLAEKIKYFIENPDKIKEMGQNGFEFVSKNFTEEGYSGKAFGILKELKQQASAIKRDEPGEDLLRQILEKKTAATSSGSGIMRKLNFREVAEVSKKARFVLKNYGIKTFFRYVMRFLSHGRDSFK